MDRGLCSGRRNAAQAKIGRKNRCELARRLGLPHVEDDLAQEFEGQTPIQPGVICPTSFPVRWFWYWAISFYIPRPRVSRGGAKQIRYQRPYRRCRRSGNLREKLPAPQWMKHAPADIATALGVFTGYVMLNAWVANQDRHHQNWAAIPDGGLYSPLPTITALRSREI